MFPTLKEYWQTLRWGLYAWGGCLVAFGIIYAGWRLAEWYCGKF